MIEELQRQLERLRLENRKLRQGYERLRRPLSGISACATKCGCCQMHRDIAVNAIDDAARIMGSHTL